MFNQTCPTRHVQPKIKMSDSSQNRRNFIKGSISKTIIAANAGIVVGLINTPGIAGATPGTTAPGTTAGTYIPWEYTECTITKTGVGASNSAALAAAKASTDYTVSDSQPTIKATPTGGTAKPTTTGGEIGGNTGIATYSGTAPNITCTLVGPGNTWLRRDGLTTNPLNDQGN